MVTKIDMKKLEKNLLNHGLKSMEEHVNKELRKHGLYSTGIRAKKIVNNKIQISAMTQISEKKQLIIDGIMKKL